MKRLITLLVLLALIPRPVFADVIRKIVERSSAQSSGGAELPGNPKTIVYLNSEGKELARELCDAKGNVIHTTGTIPDGTVKEYFENGALLAEYNYKDGKLEGTSKGYYQNGAFRGEWNYKNGKLEGKIKVFHENGKLNYEFNYKNDKRDGVSNYYDKNGKLLYEWNYREDKLEGMSKGYYENGQVKAEYNYKDDKRNGISKTYDEKGKLLSVENYKNGRKFASEGQPECKDTPKVQKQKDFSDVEEKK